MSFSSILNIARSALFTQQRAMSVTARNIAQARTPGYSRQRVILGSSGPDGLAMDQVERMRDQLFDATWRRESSDLGAAATREYFLQQVETAVNEPSDSGLSASLDDFFNSFGRLGDDPTSPVTREDVRGAARRLAHNLRRLDRSLGDALNQARFRLESEVEEVNNLAARVAELNGQLTAARQAGRDANDLLDERDRLIDELSGYLPIEASVQDDGTLSVISSGVTLVAGQTVQRIEVKTRPGSDVGIGPQAGDSVMTLDGGSLQALTTTISETLPGYRDQLDRLAGELVARVNALHREGTNSRGETGVDFFDPSGVTAGSISLATAVERSAEAIAAGRSGASGDNSLALDLAGLGEKELAGLDGRTAGEFYATFVAGIGREVRDARQGSTASQALLDSADAWRQSVSGISVEEEMVKLVAQQEAYQAAARLVGVVDDMMQEVLRIIG